MQIHDTAFIAPQESKTRGYRGGDPVESGKRTHLRRGSTGRTKKSISLTEVLSK